MNIQKLNGDKQIDNDKIRLKYRHTDYINICTSQSIVLD